MPPHRAARRILEHPGSGIWGGGVGGEQSSHWSFHGLYKHKPGVRIPSWHLSKGLLLRSRRCHLRRRPPPQSYLLEEAHVGRLTQAGTW